MPLRLLVILSLLFQQFTVSAVIGGTQHAECTAGPCCGVVKTTTCCGEVIREMRCGVTGGECLCDHHPANTDPVPRAPRPQERNDVGPLFVAVLADVIDLAAPRRAERLPHRPVFHRTHNATQALLCIWRT
jgi:hypothetical protein